MRPGEGSAESLWAQRRERSISDVLDKEFRPTQNVEGIHEKELLLLDGDLPFMPVRWVRIDRQCSRIAFPGEVEP